VAGEATPARGGLERLTLRIERLRLSFRFTFAFHAREVRFERETDKGFEGLFPETFSFHAPRHDPAELFLQLDDLHTRPRLLGAAANARDSAEIARRLLGAAPRYLERICERIDEPGACDGRTRVRVHQDVALLAQILLRFAETRDLKSNRSLRMAAHALRRRIFLSLDVLVRGRVEPGYLEAYVRCDCDPIDPSDDPSESGFFHVLETGEAESVNRIVVRMAERAFYHWLEGVCLDEENQAFEKEDSPFADRETEVLRAISARGSGHITRGADVTPFLRRPDRDCLRILKKLERWFLRQYDIPHSSAIIHHAAALENGVDDGSSLLSWHTPAIHASLLALLTAPFALAAVAYERAPDLFDVVCSMEVAVVYAITVWFLLYRFCWKRDLSFFHASVPRIGAGIIVGYLPVFMIDEVWDLARRSFWALGPLLALLALVTLLYIYIEVKRKLGSASLAFDRARGIFLLGVVQAAGVGLVMTGLVGPFMVSRNWSPGGAGLPVSALRTGVEPLVGHLPRVMGFEPFYAFPSALLLMVFLSFFIGIFLQLMWEELPITEPL